MVKNIVTGRESLKKISRLGVAQHFHGRRTYTDILTDWLYYARGIELDEDQYERMADLADNWFKGRGKCSRAEKETLAKCILKDLKIEVK